MAQIEAVIVLDALDMSALDWAPGLRDFMAESTAHSLTNVEGVEDVEFSACAGMQPLPCISGVPNPGQIIEAWRGEAAAMWLELLAEQTALSHRRGSRPFRLRINTVPLVQQMHYFEELVMPVWAAIGLVVAECKPETTVVLALAQAGPVENAEQYGRANSGGRWFVEETGDGNILRRCGLDASRAIGYWGSALKPETYDVAEILSEPKQAKPIARPKTSKGSPEESPE